MNLFLDKKQYNASSSLFWVLILIVFILQLLKHYIFNGSDFYRIGPDARYYIGGLENLLNHGKYFVGRYEIGRMPGYLPVYLPLRLILSQHQALTVFLILKVFFYSFSIVYFAFTAKTIFTKGRFFAITIIVILGLTDYISIWGFSFITESLAASTLMVGISAMFWGLKKRNLWFIFLAGVMLAWLIFLRPFMITIWIILIGYFIWQLQNENIRSKAKIIIIFLLPFIIVDGIWIVRNYQIEKRIIPLQSEWIRTDAFINYRKFLMSFGGDAVEWNPGSEGMWFQTNEFLNEKGFERPAIEIFPAIIFNDKFTSDSLIALRQLYWHATDTIASREHRLYYDSLFVIKTNEFISEFREKCPFYYHIGSRVKLFKRFLIHPYTYYLSITDESNYFQWAIKLFIYLINAMVFILGFSAMVVILGRRIFLGKLNPDYLLFGLVPLYLFTLFPFYLKFVEYRFTVLAFPFLAFFLAILLNYIRLQLKKMYEGK